MRDLKSEPLRIPDLWEPGEIQSAVLSHYTSEKFATQPWETSIRVMASRGAGSLRDTGHWVQRTRHEVSPSECL